MKNRWITVAFLAFQLFSAGFLAAQQLYLAPNGDDKNSGTQEKPLASLTAARDRARALRKSGALNRPIEIIALPGDYFMKETLALTNEDAGLPEAPLQFKTVARGAAVFYGGKRIQGFEKINDSLWKTVVPEVARGEWNFEQLYVNGERAIRAKTPNEGFFRIKKVTETVLEKGEGNVAELAVQKIALDSNEAKLFNSFSKKDFEDGVITFYHKWDNTKKHVLRFDKKESSIYILGTGMKPWNKLDGQTQYLVENFKEALDAEGEWFLDRSGVLYYHPRKGETIENVKVFAPVLKEFVTIRGDEKKWVENIQFENISFKVAGFVMPADGVEAAQAAAPVEAVVTTDFARNISFKNCELAHTGTYAFWFRRASANCEVIHCYLHDLGAGGIKLGETQARPFEEDLTKHIKVDNSIIRNAGRLFPCAVGVLIFNASDNQITHNEIADLRYTGISVGWVWGYAPSASKRNLIAYNHIHHLGWGELSDMGGVYTLGASEGTTVSNNVIHHIYSLDYGGWGLYTDEGSYGIVMENNLVYACKNSSFHQHYGKDNIIRNNIFARNLKAQLQATRVEAHQSFQFTNNIVYFDQGTLLSSNWHKINLRSDSNCYWDTRTRDIRFQTQSFSEWQKQGKDQHSIIADPLFVDAVNYDFRFKNRSVIKKINFKPFNFSKAGVYGSKEWKSLAAFDPALAKKYDDQIERLEAKQSITKN